MGAEAAFVGPLLEAELAASFAADFAAFEVGGASLLGAGGEGAWLESGAPWESSYAETLGIDPTGLGTDFSNEIYSQAAQNGMNPEEYTNILSEFGGETPTSSVEYGETLSPEVQGRSSEATLDDYGNPLTNNDGSTWQANQSQTIDQAPKEAFDSTAGNQYDPSTASGSPTMPDGIPRGPMDTLKNIWDAGKEFTNHPAYKLSQLGTNLYGQMQARDAQRQALALYRDRTDPNQDPFGLRSKLSASYTPGFESSYLGKGGEGYGLMSMFRDSQNAKYAQSGNRANIGNPLYQSTLAKYGQGLLSNYRSGLASAANTGVNSNVNGSMLSNLYGGASNKSLIPGLSTLFN